VVVNAATSRPNTTTVGVLGAVLVIFWYLISLTSWDPPPEVVGAITTIITAVGVEVRNRLAQRRQDGEAQHTKKTDKKVPT